MKKFITTSDKQVCDSLLQRGLTLVCYDGDVWSFLNNGRIVFAEDEMKKIKYTNNLNV